MSLATYSPDEALLRSVFGHYPSGVVALSAIVDGQPEVMVASSFSVGISMDPPLVAFAPQISSSTWPKLRNANAIGISMLAPEHEQLCRQLASKDRDRRFENVHYSVTAHDALLIGGCPIHLVTDVYAEHPAGDHTMVLLRVLALDVDHETEPAIFHGSQFRSLAMAGMGV